MTIFELVKVVLDSLYAEAKRSHGKKTDDAIKLQLQYLTDNYKTLDRKGRQPVDYKDAATRFAYVFKYVASHGDLLVQIMRLAGGSQRLFPKSDARLTCIGGGPGSDILGTLRYLQIAAKTEKVTKLVCYLLDREQAWADTWTEVDSHFNTGIALNTNFQPLDVTNASSWQFQRKFLQADVFTLSYFVSEVMMLDTHGAVAAFWNTLFAEAKSGAIFIYNDNGGGQFAPYFDQFWKAAKMNLVLRKDDVQMTPSGIEQSSELAAYIAKLDHRPKLRANVSYRILQKP